jgi:TetR/AcrR family transcriptional repressor of nem operon
MLAKGFTATTVDEVCAAAKLTKGSFFHYFGGKEDLGKAVLDRYVASASQRLRQAPFLRKDDPLERVYGYVDFVIEMCEDPATPNGCLVGIFSQELSDTHPKMRSLCADHFARWAAAFKEDLENAKAKRALGKAVDPQSLAEHFIAVFEGSLILARATQDRGVVRRNLLHFKRYVKSLFDRTRTKNGGRK